MIHNFPKGVMKADFWRYAVMYFYGGVYMDIDAMPLKALRDFKHYPFEEKRVVIGLENDEHLC
jgi:mannosyltransferase OCH1-like enzyme